jgi:hypothetical protein
MSMGCARQGDQTAWHILVAGGEQGTVSTGVGGHGRTALGLDSGDGHWAGRWARWAGFKVEAGFGPWPY